MTGAADLRTLAAMNALVFRWRLLASVLAVAAVGGAFQSASAQTPPAAAGTPSPPVPAGTPWPAPTDVRLEGHWTLLDDQGYPLPPDRQVRYAGISWLVLPGYSGVFEVQHAVRRVGMPANEPYAWSDIALSPFPATATVDGRIGFQERVEDTFAVHCYRVGTVINGETGPYSQPVCTPVPPASGPGQPATPAPLPPDVGNSAGAGPGFPIAGVLSAVSVALLGAGIAGASRRYLRRVTN